MNKRHTALSDAQRILVCPRLPYTKQVDGLRKLQVVELLHCLLLFERLWLLVVMMVYETF